MVRPGYGACAGYRKATSLWGRRPVGHGSVDRAKARSTSFRECVPIRSAAASALGPSCPPAVRRCALWCGSETALACGSAPLCVGVGSVAGNRADWI